MSGTFLYRNSVEPIPDSDDEMHVPAPSVASSMTYPPSGADDEGAGTDALAMHVQSPSIAPCSSMSHPPTSARRRERSPEPEASSEIHPKRVAVDASKGVKDGALQHNILKRLMELELKLETQHGEFTTKIGAQNDKIASQDDKISTQNEKVREANENHEPLLTSYRSLNRAGSWKNATRSLKRPRGSWQKPKKPSR
jgi:hypothetical protein